MDTYACLLAGGSGTRFWPASTARVPKQFLPLTGGAPMLRACYDRIVPLTTPARVVVVTAAATRDAVRELLPEVPPENVLGEPAGKNTAAACALAAEWVRARDPSGVVVSTPSDYLASPDDDLRAALGAAAERAGTSFDDRQPRLMTLGLSPTYAATGFGWIRTGKLRVVLADHMVHEVARFVEKPDRARAEQFLVQGGHVWNLGMFAWRADAFLAELATHLPATASAIATAAPHLGTAREDAALAAAYADLPSISVDHGVLEKSQNVEVVRCSFLWDDMGSFAACGRHLPKDDNENCSLGPLVAVDAHNNIAYAEDGRMTAILGVNDLVVVHAHGVTLVAPRSRAEEVKKLVDALGPAGLERFR